MAGRRLVQVSVLGALAVLVGVGAAGGQAADSFKPTTISLTLAPGASWNTSQTLHLDSLPRKADIVLAVDTTGSMGTAIANAKADAGSIVNRIKSSIPEARFAVVDFKDYPISPYGDGSDYPYKLVTGLTNELGPVQTALNGLTPSGGGDLPESLNRVFHEVANDTTPHEGGTPPHLAYDANAPRFLVVLSDDIPHDTTQKATFSACLNTFDPGPDFVLGTPDDDLTKPYDDPGPDGNPATAGDNLRTQATLETLKNKNTNVSFVTYNPTQGTPGTPNCHAQMAAYTGGLQTSHGATESLADEIVTLVKQAAAKVDEVVFATSPASFGSWVSFTPPNTSETPYGPFTAPRDIPYEMKVAVPAGTAPGSYAFTVTALADGSERATQTVNVAVRTQAASALIMTVDERSIPAAPASLPFSGIPASRIPFLGGTTSALPAGSIPAGSIPAGSIPAGSIPAGSIPAGSIPAGSIPAGSIPAGSIPAGSIPAGSIGLGNTPAGSIPAGSIALAEAALSRVLLSQIPLRFPVPPPSLPPGTPKTWDEILAGTTLANQPLNAVTFNDLKNQPVALQRFNMLQLKQIDFATSLWRGVPFAALMLGNATLDVVGPPPGFSSWARALEAYGGSSSNLNTAQNTVFGVYVAGQLGSTPAGSIPAGSINYGALPAGSIPAGSIPAGSIELGMTRLGAVHISSLVPVAPKTLAAYVNCGGGFGCNGKTLGEADAAGAINPQLTIADLFAALPPGDNGERDAARATTLDQLIAAMLPLSDYPWEQISLEGLQDVAGTTRVLHYHVDFDLSCGVLGATPFEVTVNLPKGFMPVLGSTRFSYAGGSPVTGRNPSGNNIGDFIFTSEGTSPCGTSTATRHVRMDFNAYPGLTLSDHVSDVTVTTQSQTETVNDKAPVQVLQNHEPNDEPLSAPLIQRNTLIAGHIADAGDKEYYRFDFGALPRHSKLIAYLKVPDGADFDLVVHKQFSPSLQSFPAGSIPAGSIPAGSIPVEDEGVSLDNADRALPPETLADIPAGSIPAGSIPAGSIPAGSISANRGSAGEAAQVVKRDESGEAIISVSGFNGSHSNKNYVLRLQVVDPPPLPTCPTVNLPSAPAGSLPTSVPSNPTTLYLTNQQRLVGLYGQTSADTLLGGGSWLQAVANPSTGPAGGKGVVVPVDAYSSVQTAYAAWDAKPCSVDAANAVVRKINDVVKTWRQDHPSIKNIVVLGTDQVIPMYRQDDLTSLSPELDEASDLAFTTNGLTAGNPLYASAAQNTVLTDGAYGAFTRLTWLDHELPLPQIPVSRLVETPEQINGQFKQYVDSSGLLNPQTELTAGYDFLTDGATDIHRALVAGFPGITPNTLIPGPNVAPWQRAEFLSQFLTKTPAPDIVSPNAHYSHWLAQPEDPNPITHPTQMVNTADVPADLAGRLIFVMGCHSGLNVPDKLSSDIDRRKDWVERYLASKTAVYIAQTGFGYGDTETNALTERLLTLFAQKLNRGSTTIGEQWIEALHSYYLTAGAYDVFDEKVMIEATFYGLPFYRFQNPGAAPSAPPMLTPTGTGEVKMSSVTLQPFGPNPDPQPETSADGRKWWEIDGQTLNVPYRAIQPVISRDVTVTGMTARGLFIKDLVTHDVANVKPKRAYPVIDLKAHEPDPEVENIFFPANFATLLRTGDRASASVVAGQFRPNTTGNPNLGIQRLVDSIELEVSYYNGSFVDTTPPRISQVGGVVQSTSTTFFVRADDDTPGASVTDVAILYNTGTPDWTYLPLVHDAGNLWKASAAIANPGVQIIAMARNNSGLTGFGANKAQNYISARDATAPTIQIDVPRDGAAFILNQEVTPKFSCSDTGIITTCEASAVPPLVGGKLDTSSTAGEHSFTVTARDSANNTTIKTVRYSVGFFFGFRSPIDNSPIFNLGKAGTTFPVKFALQDAAGRYISDLNTVTSVTSKQIPCQSGAPTDAIEETTTASLVSLKYDSVNNQFVYTWQTQKSWAGTCRQLFVALLDGSVHEANFQFK